MQKRSGQLGETFINLGLITQADVERALAHQRERGGYFGDALVQLGLLTQDQVRWGLADQYDIPFVQIRPENIDRKTAMAVPAAWAREHLILPVLRDGDTVTVILADPARVDRLEEVRQFTGAARVEAALSNAATLRELIDSVHGEGSGLPMSFGEWVVEALASGASAIGVSARGERVRAWSRGQNASFRSLREGWADELRRVISPFPEPLRGEPRSWLAVLSANDSAWRVECHAVGDGRALEWVAEIGAALPASFPRVPVSAEIVTAVAEGLRGQGLALRVKETAAATPGVLEVLIAALPASLGEAGCRSVHLADRPSAMPPDVLFSPVEGTRERSFAALQPYGLDALTLDVEQLTEHELDSALRVAPLVIFRTRSHSNAGPRAGLNICLRARGDELLWTSETPADATD